MTLPRPAAVPKNTPLVLIIRDGWGENPNPEHDAFNAVKLARTPVAARLAGEWPRTLIKTSGEDVGLPEGTMGNSEVGHQNIGAGRVVDQESVRITRACREGRLRQIGALVDPIARARDRGKLVHLMGIASDAGVHGLLTHLYALLDLCRELRVDDVCVHLFTDGRDTGPFLGAGFVEQVQVECARRSTDAFRPRIASVMGRYWAMDRDNRWERVERAFACLTGRGFDRDRLPVVSTGVEAVRRYYDHPASEHVRGDEFVTPTLVGEDLEDALSMRVRDGDAAVFVNFRGDRPRELVSAFVLPDKEWRLVKPSPDSGRHGFDRGARLQVEFVTMTAYSEPLTPHVHVAFPKAERMVDILGQYISRLGLRQFRCAETEKYPHVTFFFNDYREHGFPGERRENPQSPKVATYDEKPEMSAYEVRDAILRRLELPNCEHILVVNFANGDMVGHTGNLAAAVRACEVVDECVGAIVDAVLAHRGSCIVTADHGNAEQMWDPATDAPHTAHTVYDVPLLVVGDAFRGRRLRGDPDVRGWFDPAVRARRGRLADIAPTALEMMGLTQPAEMTGQSLLA